MALSVGIDERWLDYFVSYVPFIDATSLYFVKDPTEDEKSRLKVDLEEIHDFFSENKEIDWDRLTTDMTYDDDVWNKISTLFGDRASTMIKDVLELPFKKDF